jgi:hypothetical protein
MIRPPRAFWEPAQSVALKITLLWAGLSLGVAFLATPAKFLATTLTLPVALEVGRQTFQVYHWTEFGFVIVVLALGAGLARRGDWLWRLAVPSLILCAQVFWLMPALDERVSLIQAAAATVPSSSLHVVYIVGEGLKVLWLLVLGFSEDQQTPRGRIDGI